MYNFFCRSYFMKILMAKGNKTMPPDNILNEATWYADSTSNPSFININELPQMNDRTINKTQLIVWFDAVMEAK